MIPQVITGLQAAIAAAVALSLGILAGAVPAYFVGRAHGSASQAETIGGLRTSVDSCNDLARQAREAAEQERAAAREREVRIERAMVDLARIGRDAATRRDRIIATPLRGETECDRTANAIADHFRGGVRP